MGNNGSRQLDRRVILDETLETPHECNFVSVFKLLQKTIVEYDGTIRDMLNDIRAIMDSMKKFNQIAISNAIDIYCCNMPYSMVAKYGGIKFNGGDVAFGEVM
jgi:hypothetical protein